MSEINISAVLAASPRQPSVASPRSIPQVGNSGSASGRIPGFGPMTRVTTSLGEFPAQTLRKGDRVLTKDGSFLPITHISRMTFDEDYMNYHPGAQPIVIREGTFSRGVPSADVTLAPFQRINTSQPFVAPGYKKAVDAVNRAHVYRKPESIITYTVFHCGRPAAVRSEGLWIDTAP